MDLRQQIDSQLIEAMRSKEETKLSVLRMLKSAIKNAEIQKMKDLEDADILSLIQSQIKSRRDSIDLYTKGNRPELAEKENIEIEILNSFLPEQMSADEIRNIVKKAIEETNADSVKDMGKVMAALIPQVKGKADGSLVSNIVKEELAK